DLVAAGRRDAALALLRARHDSLGAAGLALLKELEAADRTDAEAAPRRAGAA
ncbi:MAG: hypothetical protein HDQ90_07375, partial [Desulfovibrio sp.]|nr:hypothetical protein [Desulfovibrio sp.]